MQKLAEVCIRRPVFAAMLVLALVVVGAACWFRLGVDRFPAVDLPTVSVRTELPGASAEEVETQVTREIEQVVNTVQGIQELRSISGPGQSIVIVDVRPAPQHRRGRPGRAREGRHRDPQPAARRPSRRSSRSSTTTRRPSLTVAVAGDRPLRELTELADKVVKVAARALVRRGRGAASSAASTAPINVWVDADRLAAYQLPITTVRDALVRQNADMPGGNVTAGPREASLRTMGRVADPRAFDDLVVATVNGAPIRVRDIGRAEDGTAEQRSVARLNGVPTVILEVRRQSGENTVAVIEAAKAEPRAPARPDARPTCGSRSSATSRATSTPRCTRSTCTWCSGSILASLVVLAVHAELAVHHHRRRWPSRAPSSRPSA